MVNPKDPEEMDSFIKGAVASFMLMIAQRREGLEWMISEHEKMHEHDPQSILTQEEYLRMLRLIHFIMFDQKTY